MNGIIIDSLLVKGGPSYDEETEDISVNHTIEGPFYFINKEEKDKFVFNLTLAFSTLYNTIKITEVKSLWH